MNFKALAHSKLNNKSGFTLIEVLVAMAVFAIGILAITGMQVTSIQGNQSARLRTEAISYASKHMDTLISNGYSAATDGSATEGLIDLEWEIFPNSPVNDAKTIVLTAEWDDKWGAKNVTLRYIMYNPD
jgi:type IV pilus modification protein PilV